MAKENKEVKEPGKRFTTSIVLKDREGNIVQIHTASRAGEVSKFEAVGQTILLQETKDYLKNGFSITNVSVINITG